MNTRGWSAVLLMTGSTALLTASYQSAGADTLCVYPGKSGCFAKIGDAVNAANAGDTIQVAPGTYFEDVIIGKSLSLIGAHRASTIIDAKGQPNGIYIDGLDKPGLSEVVVRGFTIQNANFEGILVTNASSVTISDNRVVSNNLALNVSNPEAPTCPGTPNFETNEDLDCGEGIHFSGVDHSTVANSVIMNNSGGILLSDDTGRTDDNLITGNVVQGNPYDCGITLAKYSSKYFSDSDIAELIHLHHSSHIRDGHAMHTRTASWP